ncbi:hypothetical protein LTR05_000472 [Lithohypha guttulata]|uniref:Heterokaryon incompatibility domain-containing protein n=1 Tax=Lithohypha guttulata TaxID=1690604 RepID=A0AAN7Y9C0_9EURO|nr:hypothetical protein LTR05_000472 [Lithohypha guttulata]
MEQLSLEEQNQPMDAARIIENINATVSARYTLAMPAANLLSSTSRLCPTCSQIFDASATISSPQSPSLHASKPGEVVHLSLDNVAESAKRGCHLCLTVYMNLDPAALRAFRRYVDFTKGQASPDSSTTSISRGFVSIVPIARDQARLSFRWVPRVEIDQQISTTASGTSRNTFLQNDTRNESRNTVDSNTSSMAGRMTSELNVELILMNPIYAVEPGVRTINSKATSTSSDECFEIARQWLEDCSFDHMKCSATEGAGAIQKPTYLLDVTIRGPKGAPGVKLVDGQFLDPFTEYVTLSHCWGISRDPGMKRVRLHKKTLQALRQGVANSSLPKTFAHAAIATARLGYKYLWIDALCIMHDMEQMVLDEIANLPRIYGEATLNLAATGATDDTAGLFFNRNVLALQPATVEVSDGFGISSGFYKVLRGTIWDDLVDSSPLAQRAWCFTERCLSKRTLHFTRNELLWECQQMCCSEVFPKGLPVTMKTAHEQERRNTTVLPLPSSPSPASADNKSLLPAPKISFNKRTHHQRTANWHILVEMYTEGRQTYTSDKLLGVSGLARQYLSRNRLRPHDYVAGMWRPSLPHSLLWRIHEGGRRPPRYRAPTWTWASIDGRVVSPAPSHASKQTCLEVIDVSVTMKNNDPLGLCEGGRLKVRGFMGKGSLRRTRDYWGHCSFVLQPQATSPKVKEIGDVRFENAWFDERLVKLSDEGAGIMVETLEIYLLPVIDVMDRVEGLILCATMKKGEFKRVGLFEISNGSGMSTNPAAVISPELHGPIQTNWDRFKRMMKGTEEMMNFEERLDHTNAYWFASDYTYTINIL